MKVDKYDAPDEFFYHKEHMYAKVEDDLIVVGITDFAQQLAGEIKNVVTLDEDDEVEQDAPIGTISSGKWTGKIYAPVSGEIAEVNEDVEDEPSTINEDTYGDGWIVKIRPPAQFLSPESETQEELKKLFKGGSPEFEEWLKSEIKKNVK